MMTQGQAPVGTAPEPTGDPGVSAHTLLASFEGWVRRRPDAPLLRFFGTDLTWRQVDDLSDTVAAGLQARGAGPGDRVALQLQNVPQYVIALLAIWKCGGVAVPVSTLLGRREITGILVDSGAKAIICHDAAFKALLQDLLHGLPELRTVITTTPDHYAAAWPEAFGLSPALLEAYPPDDSRRCQVVPWASFVGRCDHTRPALAGKSRPGDPAALTYTSGTTGPAKGAVNTHANLTFVSSLYREWMALDADDSVLCVAPLFHITGLVAHIGVALAAGMSMVLAYRFDTQVIAACVDRYRPTYTVGAITAFIALLNDEDVRRNGLSSLRTVYSGGAPIAPATVDAFEETFGIYIHNIYGLTEATGPVLAVPLGRRAPVDPTTGALSVGVPVFDTEIRVVDPDGVDVASGEVGELMLRGPQVVPRYWERPDETAGMFRDGWLRTGDAVAQGADAWCFVVDRLKDQINASGFKVWPREVEDVLAEHPAVAEAAVVGVPDPYRGETVKAFVVLRPGGHVSADALVAHCRERLAVYKYPRQLDIVDALPKTASGKVLRRALRRT